ncbi:unnamed protein product [Echinostoma caproni]|uniref:Uncharacterized protein n=1 Tax=Echinostoma caproni TaxID=27848 RepID=A0A183AUU1_9TREM|nr:unnamed protein product [Echinostoma caproni]
MPTVLDSSATNSGSTYAATESVGYPRTQRHALPTTCDSGYLSQQRKFGWFGPAEGLKSTPTMDNLAPGAQEIDRVRIVYKSRGSSRWAIRRRVLAWVAAECEAQLKNVRDTLSSNYDALYAHADALTTINLQGGTADNEESEISSNGLQGFVF